MSKEVDAYDKLKAQSIEQISSQLYYLLYIPDKHPNYCNYSSAAEWAMGEYPYMANLSKIDVINELIIKIKKY